MDIDNKHTRAALLRELRNVRNEIDILEANINKPIEERDIDVWSFNIALHFLALNREEIIVEAITDNKLYNY